MCRRCGFDQMRESKFCSKCGAIHPVRDKYFAANKDFLIELALKTRDKEWFEQLNRGIVTDVK